MPCLFLSVRYHDGRYHGRVDDRRPDWPPSPGRLFQALAAGAAKGAKIEPADTAALEWLERLSPPIIAAPHARKGGEHILFVPNNDLDSKDGDSARIGEIRAGKLVRPWHFNAAVPLLYVWSFNDVDLAQAQALCALSERLYQLGRGVDMAWAAGDVLTEGEAEERLAAHPGRVYRPGGAGGEAFDCPQAGTLASLAQRYAAFGRRFAVQYAPAPTKSDPDRKKAVGRVFSQPPKARFRQVAYDSRPLRLLFDIRCSGQDVFAPQPLTKIAALTERLRDGAAARLKLLAERSPGAVSAAEIERLVIGRGATPADKARRLKIIPLPTIGHPHAERSIRRVLIEAPPACPIPATHIEWAFDGLILDHDGATGEIPDRAATLVAAGDLSMAENHYFAAIKGRTQVARLWRTVTPAALPETARRRRIDPKRMHEEAKGGKERAAEEARAAGAIAAALRHVDIAAKVTSIRVQREPSAAKGARADDFAVGTRFAKERLWHAEVAFSEPVAGPMIIGDGRFLGLGLMEPVKRIHKEIFVFDVAKGNRPPTGREADFLRAVRRALMALDRDYGGSENVSMLFSGHDADGSPDRRTGNHRHAFFAVVDDGKHLTRLYVFSPEQADRNTQADVRSRRRFDEVVSRLDTVRAGRLGVINLAALEGPLESDPIVTNARTWTSATPYKPTRHAKQKSEAETALVRDIREECFRRGLPNPHVIVTEFSYGPRAGVNAKCTLVFPKAVRGPILLGKRSHFGLGLFKAVKQN